MPPDKYKEMSLASKSLIENSEAFSPIPVDGVEPLSLNDMVNGLRTVLDQTGAYIYMKDLAGRYTYANQNVQNLFGASLEDIIGKDDSHFFDLENANRLRIHDRRIIDFGEKVESEETNIIKLTGITKIYWSIKNPVHNDLGQIVGLCGISTDITSRKQTEQFEHFRSSILELITSGVAPSDTLMSIVRGIEQLNPAMLCSILLLDDQGKHLLLGAAPSLPNFYNLAIDGVEIGMGVGSCGTAAYTGDRIVVDNIATHPYWSNYKDLANRAGLAACWSQPIRASTGQILGTFAIYHREPNMPTQFDLSVIEQAARLASITIERKQIEDKIHQMAFYDPLTKLANRTLLTDRLEHAIAISQRNGKYGSLMFLDLDNFKPLNDTHGHIAGDLLLTEVATRLKVCLREVDTVARFGGDEFVVMISELDVDENKSISLAKFIAEKIRLAIGKPYLITLKHKDKLELSIEHQCTVSIGVTLFGKNSWNKEELLKKADKAMYKAKDAGRNLILFDDF